MYIFMQNSVSVALFSLIPASTKTFPYLLALPLVILSIVFYNTIYNKMDDSSSLYEREHQF